MGFIMCDHTWPDKLRTALKEHLTDDEIEFITGDLKDFENLNEDEKSSLLEVAIRGLDQKQIEKNELANIMAACSCGCYEEHLARIKKVYDQTGDIDQLIDAMQGSVFLNRPERQGDKVFITKAPRFPEKHAAAKTSDEKCRCFCHCDNARAAKNMPLTYCLCGAGWCKNIWEKVLNRPVRVEITHSVLRGDDYCRFAVDLE